MRTYFFLCVFFLTALHATTQILQGNIVNSKGDPISFSTIYIKEKALGIVSDEQGAFRTFLEKGLYTVEISSLGYDKQVLPITMADENLTLRLELKEIAYGIREITVHPGGEDPAYPIMRNAIAMAPLYFNQVKSYQADVYLKGTVKVDKLPPIVRLRISGEELKNITKKLFLVESQNEVTFTAPKTYDQRVVAMSTTIPVELDDQMAMRVATSNIYSSDIFGVVSPLAAHAFSYYKYKLEDITLVGEHLVNKIRVIPKKDNGQLVRGYIYIVENLWNVQHADLIVNEAGVTVRSHVAYNEVRPGAFLPTAYDMSVNIDMMGAKIEGKYYSSIQYKQVEVNVSLTPAPAKVLDEQTLTISKQLVKKEKKQKQKELEIQPRDSFVRITHDTLALLRDSTYWLTVRQLPLRPDEIISYKQKDSMKVVTDSLQKADSLQNRTAKRWLRQIALGEKIKLSDTYSIGYSGLLNACPEYNFVDGFWLGQKISLEADFSNKRSLTIIPSVYYLTARKQANWQIESIYKYNPIRHGKLTIRAGNRTVDYAGDKGVNRLINSLASLFFAENVAKFYQKNFVSASHTVDLAHALRFDTQIDYERRHSLDNHTSFHFWGDAPKPNRPNLHGAIMPSHTLFRLEARLQYTPRQYYRMRKGEKIYDRSSFPTFWVGYNRAIPVKSEDVSFEKIEAGIQQSFQLNLFNQLDYSIDGGIFTSAKRTYLPDYTHFTANELIVTTHPFVNSFSLLNQYQYVTNDKWMEAHVTWTSQYLLLKHIRFMQRYLFDEALHVNTLWVPGKNHTEAAYSIGLGDLGRAGVFVGFDRAKYNGAGLTVSIPMLSILLGKNKTPRF